MSSDVKENALRKLRDEIILSPGRSKCIDYNNEVTIYEIIAKPEPVDEKLLAIKYDLWPGKWSGRKTMNLMLIGETGKGKTTIINGVLNLLMDIKYDMEYRLSVPVYGSKKSVTESQTERVTVYNLPYVDGMGFGRNLVIVDTPGLLDTHGYQFRKENSKQIKKYLETQFQNNHIYVGVVVEANLNDTNLANSLTKEISSIIHQISKVTIFFIATFADIAEPRCYAFLNGKHIKSDKNFKINNGAVFMKSSSREHELKENWEMWSNQMERILNEISDNCYSKTKLSCKEVNEVNSPHFKRLAVEKEKMELAKKKELLQAAAFGDIAAVDKIVNEGIRYLKYADENTGKTALHVAAESLHYDVCKRLIEADKSLLKKPDKYGNLPLHLIISDGKSSTNLFEFFVENEVNLKALTRKKQTSLHIASSKGNADIVKLLIKDKEINSWINNKDSEGFTALHLAAKKGHTHCCKELVDAKADINAKSKLDQTALHLAAKMRFLNCCKFLVGNRSTYINSQDKDGNTALHLICNMKTNFKGTGTETCVKCVILMLEFNADLNILNKQKENAMQIAKQAPSDVLKVFEQDNANINVTQTDIKGQTILHNVVRRNEATACEVVLRICKRQEQDLIRFINQPDNDNYTALHYAIKSTSTESCKALLRSGADGNILYPHGNALHLVADSGHEDICDLIITKGTKIDVINSNNKTALQIAAHKGHAKICKSLLKNSNVLLTDSDDNTALHLAAKEGKNMCCQLLVEKNQQTVNKVNKDGRTPLHEAVINGKDDCCKVLATNKSDIWKKDNACHSAVWYAYENHHDKIFLLLVNSPIEKYCENDVEKDVNFNDIFCSAVSSQRRVVCEGLIDSENWKECLRRKSDDSGNQNLRNIVQKYPDLAKCILDKCQTVVAKEEEMKSTYIFSHIDEIAPNYMTNGESHTFGSFFKSFVFGWSDIDFNWQANHLVTVMKRHDNLLHHPIITQWVRYKWIDYGCALHYSYICFILLQIYLLLLYIMESWTWTTVSYTIGLNQTHLCFGEPHLMQTGFKSTREENVIATQVGNTFIVFSLFVCFGFIYKILKKSNSRFDCKTYSVVLTSVFNVLLVVNFTQCSQNTHIREDIQWLPGYVSSGCLLLALILTLGEHPNCSNKFFNFNASHRGAKSIIPLIAVIIISSVYHQFSGDMKTVTNIEAPTMWIVFISLTSTFVLIINKCNPKYKIRNGTDGSRRLAFISHIMDYDVLLPPLRNWSYRSEITIQKEDKPKDRLDSIKCVPGQDKYEASKENDLKENLIA